MPIMIFDYCSAIKKLGIIQSHRYSMIFELRASSFILNFALFFIKKSFAATNAVLLLPLAKACFCTRDFSKNAALS